MVAFSPWIWEIIYVFFVGFDIKSHSFLIYTKSISPLNSKGQQLRKEKKNSIFSLLHNCVFVLFFNFLKILKKFNWMEKSRIDFGYWKKGIWSLKSPIFRGENATLTLTDGSMLDLLVDKLLLPGVKKDPIV